MKSAEPNKLYKKSGIWGTQTVGSKIKEKKALISAPNNLQI